MREIFIVDDNPGKLADLVDSAKQLFPQAEVIEFEYSNDILCAIAEEQDEIRKAPNEYLMIIDMQMPPYKRGRIEIDGGFSVLAELQRLGLHCPAIIASSEPINEMRAQETYEHYKGFVRYRVYVALTSVMREILAEYLPNEEA